MSSDLAAILLVLLLCYDPGRKVFLSRQCILYHDSCSSHFGHYKLGDRPPLILERFMLISLMAVHESAALCPSLIFVNNFVDYMWL